MNLQPTHVPPRLRELLARVDALWDGPPPARRPLVVTYLLPHHQITGGVKILLEHVARLRSRGHRVRVVHRGQGDRALPAWSDVRADEEVVVSPGASLARALAGSDVAVVGWFQGVPALLQVPVPALHFEQGSEFLYGDVPDSDAGRAIAEQYALTMALPLACAAVSPFAASVIRDRFGRRCGVIPNGIDADRFSPGPGGRPRTCRVLLVGNAALAFKGFDLALRALARAREALPGLRVTWVTQRPPATRPLPFPLEVVVSPPQRELPAIYRGHDLFVSASYYESFPLPPLEAMASGVPVVATDSGGILTYARHNENALLVPAGDEQALASAALRVLRDGHVAARLARAGRQTAEAFGWERALDRLEDALWRVSLTAPAAAAA